MRSPLDLAKIVLGSLKSHPLAFVAVIAVFNVSWTWRWFVMLPALFITGLITIWIFGLRRTMLLLSEVEVYVKKYRQCGFSQLTIEDYLSTINATSEHTNQSKVFAKRYLSFWTTVQ
jgi:hypothetical protein